MTRGELVSGERVGGDFLAQMAEASRERARQAMSLCPAVDMLRRAHATPRPPRLSCSAEGFDLIAEVKLRSPAAGALRDATLGDIVSRACAYASAGAAAVSVLTEPERFDGALAHLEGVAAALSSAGGGRAVPAMRKDFLVDPYQVSEARAAGAGGVLVILRMLPRGELEALIDHALELELFVLLEAFDESDIELAHALVEARASRRAQLLVGVNSRDLATLQVIPGRLEALATCLPRGVPRVAESGLETAGDAARVAAAGYDLALVGSALMKERAPELLVRDMLAAGRKVVRPCG